MARESQTIRTRATAADLIALGEDPNDYDKHFILTADIDLDPNLPGQKVFDKAVITPEGSSFTGVFDGNGHTISHLTITGGGYLGLFGRLASGAEVRSLGVVDVNIVGSDDYIGGLAGENSGSITTSYSTGAAIGRTGVGGLMGVNQGDVIACFWDTQTSGRTWSAAGTGKTIAEMKTASTFLEAGWDFVDETVNGTEDIWRIIEGQDYPCLWWEAPRVKYSGGTGEPDDPYQIATAEDLIQLGNSPENYGKHFILTADIDLDPDLPGGKVFDKAVIAPHAGPFGWPFSGPPFAGVFDGGDHTISNLTINGTRCAGLVGQLASGAEVKNVRLVGANVSGSDGYTGGLVGLVGSSGAAVTNCSCEGTVSGHSYIGGLVGYGGARITRCYSSGTVDGSKWSIGGLVGYSCGYIQQCYSTAAVSGATWVGGLVGENANTVTECYSTGSVTGYSNVGGLVGYDYTYSQAVRCFWDTQTSSRAWSAGGTGRTTTQMKMASTFLNAGWDFLGETDNGTEDVWWIDERIDYPRLSWEMPLPIPGFGEGVDPNLVGWWRFNEGYGTIAFDSSGNENHGTLSGSPQWVQGYYGHALQFANDDYVRAHGYAGVTGTDPRTCCAWIKTTVDNQVTIISWGENTDGQKWRVRAGGTGALRIEVAGGYNTGVTYLLDGEWHHIAIAFEDDGTPNVVDTRLYVDGQLELIESSSDEPVKTASSGTVQIGEDPWNDKPFEGSIDDVRIYDRALRSTEIRVVMANPGVVPQALAPYPRNGAVIDVNSYTLCWTPGDLAVSHQVYIGENFDDVNEGKMAPILTTTSFLDVGLDEPFPAGLNPGATYYWRVDEVNEAELDSPWKGRVWTFSVDINATFTEKPKPEGFETGDFGGMDWTSYGDQDWSVTSGQSYSGTYSARAGSIEHNESSVLEVTLDCMPGQISFYCKVSSESNYDCLRFYINGEEQDDWSGEEDWTEVSFPVSKGRRTFGWEYSKDGSASDGDDTAWIDDVTFPIDD